MRFLYAVLFSILFGSTFAFAQDAEEPAAVVEDATTEEPTEEAAAEGTEAPAEDGTEEAEATEEAGAEEAPAEETEAGDEEGELSPEEIMDTVQLVLSAAKEGKWGIMIAAILMLVIWVIRTFLWKSIPSGWLPYATLGVSTAAAFAAAVIAGTSIGEALLVSLGGLFTGLSAVGAWETLGKKLLPKAKES